MSESGNNCSCGRDVGDGANQCVQCGQYWCGNYHCAVPQLVMTKNGHQCTRCLHGCSVLVCKEIDNRQCSYCDLCAGQLCQWSEEDSFKQWGRQMHLTCLERLVTRHVAQLPDDSDSSGP